MSRNKHRNDSPLLGTTGDATVDSAVAEGIADGLDQAAATAEAPPTPPAPIGREPRVGDWVYFWTEKPGGGCEPEPAQLMRRSPTGRWCLNVQKLGRMPAQRFDVRQVSPDAPEVGCWSWME